MFSSPLTLTDNTEKRLLGPTPQLNCLSPELVRASDPGCLALLAQGLYQRKIVVVVQLVQCNKSRDPALSLLKPAHPHIRYKWKDSLHNPKRASVSVSLILDLTFANQ